MGNVYSSIGDGNSGGDVVGPASSTDNAVARFDGTTGKLLQNSVAILDDSGNLSGIGTFLASGDATVTRVQNGGAVELEVGNDSNTAGSHAQIDLNVAGASGGDPKVLYTISGVAVRWHHGSDNDDSDTFKIGQGASVGSSTEFSITTTSVSKLHNGVAYKLTTTAVSYNVLVTDYFIGVTSNAAARTITLPSTAIAGQTFTVKDQAGTAGGSGGGFAITVDAAGGKTIDGAASATINSDYGSLRFYYDGTNYFIY